MKHVGPVMDLVLKMDAQRILAPDLQYLSSHARGVSRAHDRQDESWKPNALPDEDDFSVKWPANSPDRFTVSAVIDEDPSRGIIDSQNSLLVGRADCADLSEFPKKHERKDDKT